MEVAEEEEELPFLPVEEPVLEPGDDAYFDELAAKRWRSVRAIEPHKMLGDRYRKFTKWVHDRAEGETLPENFAEIPLRFISAEADVLVARGARRFQLRYAQARLSVEETGDIL